MMPVQPHNKPVATNVKQIISVKEKGCHAGPRPGIHEFGVMDCGSESAMTPFLAMSAVFTTTAFFALSAFFATTAFFVLSAVSAMTAFFHATGWL